MQKSLFCRIIENKLEIIQNSNQNSLKNVIRRICLQISIMGSCNCKTSSAFTQELKLSGNQYILKLKSEIHVSGALEKLFQELHERLDLLISENADSLEKTISKADDPEKNTKYLIMNLSSKLLKQILEETKSRMSSEEIILAESVFWECCQREQKFKMNFDFFSLKTPIFLILQLKFLWSNKIDFASNVNWFFFFFSSLKPFFFCLFDKLTCIFILLRKLKKNSQVPQTFSKKTLEANFWDFQQIFSLRFSKKWKKV